ncbi:sensor domain-containing protein [Planotetraspora phitsanulokensis]|uniref:histidine kinase n=1 Tax=Planotetraspora phitsanulokensis TaxID=575192 RepID=A0A8J3XG97_9ACTN|nr:histidine kinase [Planotetraspora phitsanulokensis]
MGLDPLDRGAQVGTVASARDGTLGAVVNIWAPARAHGVALIRGLLLAGLKPVAALVALLPVLVVADGYAGVVSLTLLMMFVLGRRLAGLSRRLAGRWGGIEIPGPYLLRPALQQVEHGWYWTGYDYHHSRWVAKASLYTNWFFRDPATWRDLLWLLVDPVVGGVFALAPAALVTYGLASAVLPWLPSEGVTLPELARYGVIHGGSTTTALLATLVGAATVLLGVAVAPSAVRAHARWTHALLAPTRQAWLARRVERLTETRTDAINAQAAELRRIERDLHDGAQARLVAIGMTLGAAEQLLRTDPAAVAPLLVEARESSAAALRELRDLVHGIYPPVLAERGLGDALRLMALENPLDVTVQADLSGRPEPPLESAAYFAVSEALTNAVRHASARHAQVEIRHDGKLLRIVVRDDGQGGADPSRGSGLRGLQRRLSVFDGNVIVDSPRGGPTELTMEIPCALSSPRTSTS